MDEMKPSAVDNLTKILSEKGSISVADYMALCLTAGGVGYYRNGNPIGASGDFVTAPEVSQIFGELIGVWVMIVWEGMGRPQNFILAELGPGRGTLMQDVMRATRAKPEFRQAAHIHLVETSTSLREAQGKTLRSVCRPEWHESFTALPEAPAIIVANEFFDALPTEQYVFHGDSWYKRVLMLDDNDRPVFTAGRLAVPPVEILPDHLPNEGDILEHCPAAVDLVSEIGSRGKRAPCALLITDYGYDNRDFGDTLQAVSAHNYVDPIQPPGTVDLSTHVNFAELRTSAREAGLTPTSVLPQNEFLMALGLEQRLRRLMTNADEEQRAALFLGARRLVDPFQMGSLFKAMAITSAHLPPPPPFSPESRAIQ
ncbi:MAG: SAM-dependent methyltransferase [Hyphomicrobiales bacterium]|nr:SAM-dependent methyltransferase [Hyphomicrobiales bacterium]